MEQKQGTGIELDPRQQDLIAGIAEMRSVADRLIRWARDLEKSVEKHSGKHEARSEMAEVEGVSAQKPDMAPEACLPDTAQEVSAPNVTAQENREPETASQEAVPSDDKASEPLTLAKLRSALALVCAAGFTEKVKALISSYGVSTLGEVPEEAWPALKAAAEGLVT